MRRSSRTSLGVPELPPAPDQDDYGNVTWQPNDPTTLLRRKDGGSIYTLFYYSTRYPLTKEDLVRLAESMTLEPVQK